MTKTKEKPKASKCVSQCITKQTLAFTDYVECALPKHHKGKHSYKTYTWTSDEQR